MKRIVSFLFFCIISFLSAAQLTQKQRKVVPLMPQQTFYLDDGVKATVGGRSRVTYKIDLPKNTIEWYYIVTTVEGETPDKISLNLVAQLSKLLDAAGITAITDAAIVAPAGSGVCNVYLMDSDNAEAFLQKADNSGGSFRYKSSGTRENFREGTVQIKDAIAGTYYLGFKNLSASKGITIVFEAAAIVEELVENNTDWVNDTKQNLYNTFYQGLKGDKLSEEEAKEIANCLVEKITIEKTPGQYYAMSETEKENFLKERYSSCAAKYEDIKGPDYEKATNYANLGWKAFEKGNIDWCIEYSKKALELDSSLGHVKATLGLCYLIKNDESTATGYYMEALSDIRKLKLRSQRKEQLISVLQDLKNARTKYPALKGSEEVKALYEEELKKY